MTNQHVVSILRVGTPQFAIAFLATLVVSILICRRRIERKQQLFLITTLGGTLIVNAILLVVTLLLERILLEGSHVFTTEAWEWQPGFKYGMASAVFWASLFAGLSTFVSILPAIAVAAYYDRRSKKNEPHPA
jgi:lysylphosphatidylglycerol synthetase-like protein (DUF2156 family)